MHLEDEEILQADHVSRRRKKRIVKRKAKKAVRKKTPILKRIVKRIKAKPASKKKKITAKPVRKQILKKKIMDINEDSLTKRRTRRILKKKGQKGVYKVQKRKARRKAKIKKVVGKTVGAVALAPLRPFKKPMERALSKKGVSTKGMKFRAVVGKFFNEFVSKQGNKNSSYEPIDEVEFYNDRSFVLPVNDVEMDSDSLAITTATIATVITGIINLFKKAKEKRQAAKGSGLSLSEVKEIIPETDLQFGKDAEIVEKKLEEKAKESKPVTQTQTKKMIVYAVVLIVLGGLVYLISKKK